MLDRRAISSAVRALLSQAVAVSAGLLIALPIAATVHAAALQAGDFVLLASPRNGVSPNPVLRLDPVTLAATNISPGTMLIRPLHAAVDHRGRILVTEETAGVVLIDATTGAQSVFTSKAVLGGSPGGITVTSDDRIFMTTSSPAQVLQLDRDTGAPTLVSSAGMLQGPGGLTAAADGQLYVAEATLPATNGSIVRVDPVSGAQSLVATSTLFVHPFDIAFWDSDDLVTLQYGAVAGREGCFIKTRVSDGTSTEAWSSYCRSQGIAVGGGRHAISDCATIGPDCYTLYVSNGTTQINQVGGILAVVPDGATPARTTSWGRLKTIYR